MIYLLKVVIFPSFLRVYQRVMMFSISIHRQIFADLLDPLWPTMTHSCLGFWNDISAMPRRHSDFSQENGGEKPSKSYGETWFFHIFPILIMCFGRNPCLFRPNLEKYRWKDVWCHCEANHVDHLQRINWHALMIAITITVIDLPKWYPPRQSTKCTSGFIEKKVPPNVLLGRRAPLATHPRPGDTLDDVWSSGHHSILRHTQWQAMTAMNSILTG